MNNEHAKVTPKDFFLWLGAMVALYISVGSFTALLFEYIDYIFGPAIVGYNPYAGGMSFAMAALIVLFPVYVYLTRVLNQGIRMHPEKKELWVRRWLVFLTVFAAGLGMVIDLIVLLTTFFAGDELTAAFATKVIAIFAIFGAVFYYYTQEIRGKWEQNEKLSRMIGMVVGVVILVSIIGGFFIMGSPQTQRELRNDQTRISDLTLLEARIEDYYRDKQVLPEMLEDVTSDYQGSYLPTDPHTGELYEYNRLGATTYELCATFAHALPHLEEGATPSDDWRVRDLERQQAEWGHEAGHTCFEREIDPDRLKPLEAYVR